MIDLDELNDRFGLEGELGFTELENGLAAATISNKYAEADIYLYGAHVASFKPHKTMGILWLSPQSSFEVGKPIRGGIPVCFPWFGLHPTDQHKPQHGFGRLMYWNVAETSSTLKGETMIRFQLSSSEETREYWPYDFIADLTVIVGQKLTVSLKVTNTSSVPFEYGCALHSYYSVSAIDHITLEGLGNTRYINQLQPGDFIQEEAGLQIKQAETRHYQDTESTVILDDPYFKRRIKIAKAGSRVTTVWNPWAETCAKIPDLPDEAYQSFVCVEAVNSFNNTIRLAPGESHETSAVIALDD